MTEKMTTRNTTDILPIIEQMDKLKYLGDTLVKSGMIPSNIKTPEAAVAIILKGREIGIGPMEAFSSINIIQGKPTISPRLMMALAERSGQLTDYEIVDDGNTCTVTVKRGKRVPFSSSFSMDDAKAMGLAGKDNWKKQPKVMRQWRAISAAFRPVFADVLAGLYIPEKMGATVDEEGSIIVDAETVPDAPDELEAAQESSLEDLLPDKDESAEPFYCETPDGETFRKGVHATKNEIGKLCIELRAKKNGDQDTPEAQAAIKKYTDKLYREVFAYYGVEGSKDPALTEENAVKIMSVLQGKRNDLNAELRELMDEREEESVGEPEVFEEDSDLSF